MPHWDMPAGRSAVISPTREGETPGMVTIGIDAHKRSHTIVVADEQGRQLATRTIGTTTADHLALLSWARRYGDQLVWSRTAGTSRVGWSATCSQQASRSSGCHRS